jgi:hypothetical protein
LGDPVDPSFGHTIAVTRLNIIGRAPARVNSCFEVFVQHLIILIRKSKFHRGVEVNPSEPWYKTRWKLLLPKSSGPVRRVALAQVGSAGILYARPSFANRPIRAKLVRPRAFLRKTRVLDSNMLRSRRAGESVPHMRIHLRIQKSPAPLLLSRPCTSLLSTVLLHSNQNMAVLSGFSSEVTNEKQTFNT